MFTIKHIEKSGRESLETAESVSFEPAGEERRYDSVVALGGTCKVSGDYNRYASGKVYVMNDAGKTVSAYDLSTYDMGR